MFPRITFGETAHINQRVKSSLQIFRLEAIEDLSIFKTLSWNFRFRQAITRRT